MRKLFVMTVALMLGFCAIPSTELSAADGQAPAAQKDTLRILAIGNGWTDNVCEADMYGFFEAGGQPVIIGYVTKLKVDFKKQYESVKAGAADFTYHKIVGGQNSALQGVTIESALRDEPWDVVTFQQQSAKAAKPETIDPWLGKMLKFVRKRTPKDVRLMYFQTWPYARQSTAHWMYFGHNNKDMYPGIAATSKQFVEKYKLEVIPVGTAIQSLRSSFNMEGDITHLDRLNCTIGCYTAAATWFEAITGRDARDVEYSPYTMPNFVRRDMAKKCAHFANVQPFEMTSMVSGTGSYGSAEGILPNYDESKVPEYTLPDPLVMNDGTPVTTVEQWEGQRREEILELFRSEVYGRSAPRQPGQHYKVVLRDSIAIGGLATREEVLIYFDSSEEKYIRLLAYYPNRVEGPVPAFVFLNTSGNASVNEDKTISYPDAQQLKNYEIHGYPPHGMYRHFYPIEMILDRGYAFLTFFKSDVDPDFDDGFQNGVHPYIYKEGQTFPEPDQWAGISAYAWGMSRVMDWVEEAQTRVDSKKVITIGHSRGGKTALWAAAQDQRFAMAIDNDGGCGAAAIYRRKYGQTVRQITISFPQWFCANHLKYIDHEELLPVDQHELVALIAPRPVYVGTASGDRWADPKGEFLGLAGAQPVYALYGYKGLPEQEWPKSYHRLFGDRMGYHMRDGKHCIYGYDWQQYLDFADIYFKNK